MSKKNKNKNKKGVKNLDESVINLAREYYNDKSISWDSRIEKIGKMFGVTERTTRRWLATLEISKPHEIISPQYEKAKKRKLNKKHKRFIFTWGQSESEPHEGFLTNLEVYAKSVNASIHVIAGRYKNPTSLMASANVKASETWHSRLLPYLDANRHNIHKYLTIFSDVKVQPTAINPMSSMQSFSGINSSIFGSPKIHMETIAVLEGQRPKLMATTGACTLANYTDTKAGKKGDFHHTLGFVIVEIEDAETFHLRQVSAKDDGSFCDWIYSVKDGNVKKIKKCSALVMGDIHYGQHDEKVIQSTHDIIKTHLKPKNIILHDVFDGYSINHHEAKDPFIQYGNECAGTNDLSAEIDGMLDFIGEFSKYKSKVVVVRSNHDDFLDRWLKNSDWKKQSTAKNYRCYMKFSDMLLEQYEVDQVKGVIPAIIENRFGDSVVALGENDSYRVHDWELGLHGHIGASGSRGTLGQFRKLNSKMVVGHYHAPERKDGALSVGTSTKLRMRYNKGASRWMHSHVIIHDNGKAQHIFLSENIKGTLKCAL